MQAQEALSSRWDDQDGGNVRTSTGLRHQNGGCAMALQRTRPYFAGSRRVCSPWLQPDAAYRCCNGSSQAGAPQGRKKAIIPWCSSPGQPPGQIAMREGADAARREGRDQAQKRRATLCWTRAATARPRRPDTSRAPGRESCVNIFPLYAMDAIITNNTRGPARTPAYRSLTRPHTVSRVGAAPAGGAVAAHAFWRHTHDRAEQARSVGARRTRRRRVAHAAPTNREPSRCRTGWTRPRQRGGEMPSSKTQERGGPYARGPVKFRF